MILHGTDIGLPASLVQDQALRRAIGPTAGRNVEFYSEALDVVRFPGKGWEPELVAFLRLKYAGFRPDAVVAITDVALGFLERHRDDLWAGAPIVFSSVPASSLAGRRLGPGITGVAVDYDFAGTLDLATALQPAARRLVVVSGIAPYDRSWDAAVARAAARHPGLRVEALAGCRLEECIEAVRGLRPSEAIVLYTTMFVDGGGATYLPRDAVARLAPASGAPVYSPFGPTIGEGTVGGSLTSFEAQARALAGLTLRVLRGEDPAAIPVLGPPPFELAVDARALERYGLRERALPPGCEVLFRPPSAWREHRREILAVAAVVLAQTLLIAALLVQSRRRVRAEEEAAARGRELAHAARLAVIGELTTSIAHEINQPLGAILANADAAEILLEAGEGPPAELREIVADIRKQDLRASEVIRRVRSLARRREIRRAPLDVNGVVADVVELLAGEARRRRVHVDLDLAAGVPAVDGDRVGLEQVLVNLVLNACEAMASAPEERRRLRVSTAVGPGPSVLVAVADEGPGVPPEAMPRLFDSFFTTKEEGLGLGLSIARSILEALGGRLRAENREPHGAVFTVELPLAEER